MAKLKKHVIKWYGYRRDQKDPRDHIFTFDPLSSLPLTIDLRNDTPKIMNQGQLGSCVTHGCSVALRYLLKKNGKPDHAYSRLQLYYDGRDLEGTVSEDSGLEIRDAIKCIAKKGVGHETLWPYVISKFKRKPSAAVYTDALKYQSLAYQRVTVSTSAVQAAVASCFPVIIGLTLFESFESELAATTGIIPMPDIHNEQMIGGHCMAVVGYGQQPGHFTVQNSWGAGWGDKGFCYMPYDLIGSSKFGSDYWIITKAEQ